MVEHQLHSLHRLFNSKPLCVRMSMRCQQKLASMDCSMVDMQHALHRHAWVGASLWPQPACLQSAEEHDIHAWSSGNAFYF